MVQVNILSHLNSHTFKWMQSNGIVCQQHRKICAHTIVVAESLNSLQQFIDVLSRKASEQSYQEMQRLQPGEKLMALLLTLLEFSHVMKATIS